MGYLMLISLAIILSLFLTHSMRWGIHIAPYPILVLSGVYVLFGSGDLAAREYLYFAGFMMIAHLIALELSVQEQNAKIRNAQARKNRS